MENKEDIIQQALISKIEQLENRCREYEKRIKEASDKAHSSIIEYQNGGYGTTVLLATQIGQAILGISLSSKRGK